MKKVCYHTARIIPIVFLYSLFLCYFQSQAQSCNYIDYFVPQTTDSVKWVNIHVWHLTHPYKTSPWVNVDSADAASCINSANGNLANISAPFAPKGGVPHIVDSKIRLVFKAFTVISDSLVYDNDTKAYDGVGNPNGRYYDEDAINMYLMTNHDNGMSVLNLATKNDDTLSISYGPKSWIRYAGSDSASSLMSSFGINLVHELGHMLGLNHVDTLSFINFKEQACSTCTSAITDDYNLVMFLAPCQSGYSNNTMNPNDGCYGYLSPRQMAVMHYHLMTSRWRYLTSASYARVTKADTIYNYTVSGTETWTTPRFYKGNIIVPYGTQLNIQCQVGMQNKGKVIIKCGGKVTIDGGKVTNISHRLWEGFDVHGNPLADQTGLNLWTNHGQLWIINGGTIENSINGVRNYGYNASGAPDFWLTGGIILAVGGKFINNVRDVEFYPFPLHFGSFSRFYECEFKTTGIIHDYNAPYVHVSICGVSGIKFNGCIFENALQGIYPNTGQGIHSSDAIYTIDESPLQATQFKGFSEGMSVYNNNYQGLVNVYNSVFENNTKGMEFSTMKFAQIDNNTFTNNYNAVCLTNCKEYRISNNTFNGASNLGNGIYAVSSGAGAHRIYRNTFNDLGMGICAQFDNSGQSNIMDGLFMNCNVFNASPNLRDIAMIGANNTLFPQYFPTVAMSQGVSSGKAKDLVRNQYGATCVSGTSENKWWINAGNKKIDHAANSDAVTRPLPQPNCSDTLVKVSNSNISFNFGLHCLAGGNRPVSNDECPCSRCCLYDDISLGLGQELANTEDALRAYHDSIDGGDTQALLDALYGGTLSGSQLKDLLEDHSPYLSDTVLKAFILNSNVSPSQVAAIHNLNKPVTAGVWSLIQDEVTDVTALATMTDQQDDRPFSERESLEGMLSRARADLQFIYSEKLSYFLQDTLEGAQDTVIRLLAQNLGYLADAPVQLARAYVNAGYAERGFAYADSLKNDAQYSEIMSLEMALMELDTSRSGVFRLLTDTLMQALLEDYATDSLKAGSWQARAALHEVFGRNMNFVYLLPEEEGGGERRIAAQANTAVRKENAISGRAMNGVAASLQVFPNPAGSGFSLLYSSPEAAELHYSIRDLLGRERLAGSIRTNLAYEIDAGMLGNGIYFISLIQEDRLLEKRKLVIMK